MPDYVFNAQEMAILQEDATPVQSDYAANLGDNTKKQDKSKIKKFETFFALVAKLSKFPVVTQYQGNISGFFKAASEEDIDLLMAKYVKVGSLVRDKTTDEKKLPTGPSFNTFKSFLKRLVNQYYLTGRGEDRRVINFKHLRTYTVARKKIKNDIKKTGNISSNPTKGITRKDRKVIDELHMKYAEHPSIMMSKIRYDFAKAGALRSREAWHFLKVNNFLVTQTDVGEHTIDCITMKTQMELHPKTRED